MITALVAPVVASVLLAVLGPRLATRSDSWVAVRLIPATALLVAASTLVALAAFAIDVLARVDGVATVARLSVVDLPTAFRSVPIPAGLAVGLIAAALVAATAQRAVAFLREVLDTRRTCRVLPAADEGVHIVVDERPLAFAVLGRRGQVVVSTGLWSGLVAADRAAVLAHERAHLRRRHHLSVIAVRIAAAADPLLRPVVAPTRFAVEREADEDAAVVVGSRRAVGRAIAHAGLAVAASREPGPAGVPALSVAAGDVPRRVEALLASPCPARRWVCAPLLALAVLAAALTLGNAFSTDHHIDRARAALAASARRG